MSTSFIAGEFVKTMHVIGSVNPGTAKQEYLSQNPRTHRLEWASHLSDALEFVSLAAIGEDPFQGCYDLLVGREVEFILLKVTVEDVVPMPQNELVSLQIKLTELHRQEREIEEKIRLLSPEAETN